MAERIHYRHHVDLGGGHGRYLGGGEHVLDYNRLFRPDSVAVRAMLADVRRHLGLSVAQLAATLGASQSVARAWCDGRRNPTGSARRLVWLIHTRLFAPEPLEDCVSSSSGHRKHYRGFRSSQTA